MDTLLRVSLARESVRRFAAAAVILNAVFLVGTWLLPVFEASESWRLTFVARLFDLGKENNPAAWYSAMLLLAAAAAMLLCFAIERHGTDDAASRSRGARILDHGWLVLALIFLLLSLDELGSLHERPTPMGEALLPQVSGLDGWVAFLAIPIAAVAALMLAFAWLRVRESSAAFGAMLVGVALFVSVPIQEQYEISLRIAAEAQGEFLRRARLHYVLEEGAELFGTLAFALSALLYGGMRLRQRGGPMVCWLNLLPVHLAMLGAVTLFLFASIFLVYPFPPNDALGVPHNWAPAAIAVLAAGLCLHLTREARADRFAGAAAVPLLLLGLVNVGLSADHGSAHLFSEQMFARFELFRDVLLALAIVGSAVLVVRSVRSPGVRAGVALWVLLLLLVFPAGPAARPALSLAASFALLFGLRTLLPAGGRPVGPGLRTSLGREAVASTQT